MRDEPEPPSEADGGATWVASVRALEEREQLHQPKLAALRGAVDEGERSEIAEGGSFARVRARLALAVK